MSVPHRHLPSPQEPLLVPRSQHTLTRRGISPEALKVLYRLRGAGYLAYLVGGGVRDLLLGLTPQDFDISTDAHPHQVRELFGNCRLIGRRFRLAHIHFRGGKIIEVATFRRQSEFFEGDGPVTSDNTFGNAAEDAFRRDFTINALFYNIADFSLIDYVGGLADLSARLVRCIGDPYLRFPEDPIRILRAVRMAASLGFTMEEQTLRAMADLKEHIWSGALPRIYDEVLRMMTRGSAYPAFELLHRMDILSVLFPEIAVHISHIGTGPYRQVLSRMDDLARPGREIVPSLFFSVLFFPLYDGLLARSSPPHPLEAIRSIVEPPARRLQIPRRVQDSVRQLLASQSRFWTLGDPRHKPRSFLAKPYFADALTLFGVTAGGTPQAAEILEGWRALSGGLSRPEHRAEGRPAGRKGKPPGGRPHPGPPAGYGIAGGPPGESPAEKVLPRKRRRRRRRRGRRGIPART